MGEAAVRRVLVVVTELAGGRYSSGVGLCIPTEQSLSDMDYLAKRLMQLWHRGLCSLTDQSMSGRLTTGTLQW